MRLHGKNLTLTYDQVVVATDLTIEIPDGKVTALIGPNGSGKSTALRALARLLKPKGGEVVLDGKSIQTMSPKQVAQKLAILPQLLVSPESITVEELVAYGRHPQRTSMLSMNDDDREAIEWAIDVTGMQELRYRPIDELSGGQRQRAWIALVLAQGTDLILLDEPTTFLDIAFQLDVLELLRELNERDGKTIVMVLHDINMAAEYAHVLLALRDGKIIAAGDPKQILSSRMIRDVFGIESHVMDHPVTGQPMCLPIPGAEREPATATAAPASTPA